MIWVATFPTFSAGADPGAKIILPKFLPDHFRESLWIADKPILLLEQEQKAGYGTAVLQTVDGSARAEVVDVPCDGPRCKVAFQNILDNLNALLTKPGGTFTQVTERLAQGQRHSDAAAWFFNDHLEQFLLIERPNGVRFWSVSTTARVQSELSATMRALHAAELRQIAAEALAQGNVSAGHYGAEILAHAKHLIEAGEVAGGLDMIRAILPTSPYLLGAHFAIIDHSPKADERLASATVIRYQAETPEAIARASRVLSQDPPSLQDYPPISAEEGGLRVILVPIEPVNAAVLPEVAAAYEDITDVPVLIRRLPNALTIDGPPDRFFGQRRVQEVIARLSDQLVDFDGWTFANYRDRLLTLSHTLSALDRYNVREMIEAAENRPGQYRSGPYLDWFASAVAPYRSGDRETMYVAVTGANLFAGDTNYVFNTYDRGARASLLSHHMMSAEGTEEPHESRPRMVRRVAKELVPATLQALGIPRAVDPSDPYSYSSGVQRTDEKSMRLSPATAAALDKFRR